MFESYEYVKAICDCGSFLRASEKLCITQPALSIAIRKLEENLGVRLFDRGRKPIALTEEGEKYLKAAKEASLIEKRFREELTDSADHISGHLSIGAAGISMAYLIPDILEHFMKSCPQVKIDVTEESFYTLKDLLMKEEIDLLVDNDSFTGDFGSERLFQNTLLYAVPENMIRNAELCSKGFSSEDICQGLFLRENAVRITLQEVLDLPYLSLHPRNELYPRAEECFAHYGDHPETLMHLNQQLTAYRFVQKGYGAAFVSDTLVRYYPSDKVRFYLFDCPMRERWIAVGYKKNHYQTAAMKAFIRTAKEVFGQ